MDGSFRGFKLIKIKKYAYRSIDLGIEYMKVYDIIGKYAMYET